MPVEDDPDIADAHTLYRALGPTHFTTAANGKRRVNSTAFQPSSDGSGTSVVVAERMGRDASGTPRRPSSILTRFADHELRKLLAGEVRTPGDSDDGRLGVVADPRDDEPGHANITWPVDLSNRKAHKLRRLLADRAQPLAPGEL